MDQIIITLRPLPDDTPPMIRLRRALKALLRSYRLRCVRISTNPGNGKENHSDAKDVGKT